MWIIYEWTESADVKTFNLIIKKKISLAGEILLLTRITFENILEENHYKSEKNAPFKKGKFYAYPLNYKKYKCHFTPCYNNLKNKSE